MIVDSDDCNFRILGPVQVIAGGAVLRFARPQQLDLIAFMLLHAEQAIAADQIVAAMWGEAAPRSASTQVRNMLSSLRATLKDETGTLATLDREPAGYRLHITTGRLDLAIFTALIADSRVARSPTVKASLLRQALGLWQGTVPLAGVRAVFADAARVYLKERRDNVVEGLFAAELDCGNHAEIVPALTDAVSANPGRERLIAQLMVALYRSGRTGDALGVYRGARHTLAEEFGLEPGPMLRDLERRILLGDPKEDVGSEIGGEIAKVAVKPAEPAQQRATHHRPDLPVPAQLPLDVRGFAGRGKELGTLNALAAAAGTDRPSTAMAVVVLMGTAGVGKTALAVHWAHLVTEQFPDGQLYVNLRGFGPGSAAMSPAEAVRGFLDALAVPPDQIPVSLEAQAALYRSLVSGRRVLVVLDNALDADQIRPLLPGTPGCLAVVTSRNQLTGLVAAQAACPVTLDLLTPAEARDLLVGRLGAERVAAEPQAVQDVVDRCARLPLALAIVAARAAIRPSFPLTMLAGELSAARDKLAALSADEVGTDARATFSWSYERLAPPAARLFRLLGRHPGPDFTMDAAASLAGEPVDSVRIQLTELARAHLLTEHVPGRYVIHDLLRAYGAELSSTVDCEPERLRAVRRLIDHYLHSAYHAATLIYPHRIKLHLAAAEPCAVPIVLADADEALAWFAAEHAGLVAAVSMAAELSASARAWQLASALVTFLDRQGHWHDWIATHLTALAATERDGDLAGQAHMLGDLGLAYERFGRFEQAHAHLLRAQALLNALGDTVGQAYNHMFISAVYDGQGELEAALDHTGRAQDLFRSAGHRLGLAKALHGMGWYHAQRGHYAEAIAYCEESVALHVELGDLQGAGYVLSPLALAHHHLGHHSDAVECFQQAIAVARESGDRYYEAKDLHMLGDTLRAAGDTLSAGDAWRRALEIFDDLGSPDQVAELLGKLHSLNGE